MTNNSHKQYPDPPGRLSDRSKQLWTDLVGKRIGGSRIATFQTALEYLDLADAARQERNENGLVLRTKRTGVPHLNPVLRVEQQAREAFIKTWRELGLNREAPPENPLRAAPVFK
jgi:phage terminase small subunit